MMVGVITGRTVKYLWKRGYIFLIIYLSEIGCVENILQGLECLNCLFPCFILFAFCVKLGMYSGQLTFGFPCKADFP